MRDMTHSYVWQDSFLWRDSFLPHPHSDAFKYLKKKVLHKVCACGVMARAGGWEWGCGRKESHHRNESCHTHEWVMSHTWMSHVLRENYLHIICIEYLYVDFFEYFWWVFFFCTHLISPFQRSLIHQKSCACCIVINSSYNTRYFIFLHSPHNSIPAHPYPPKAVRAAL